MGNTSYWLPAAISLGAAAVGIGIVFLLGQARTRTNVGIGAASVLIGLAIATTYPFIDDVSRADPGWLPRLQGLLEAAAGMMTALYLSGLLATAQVSERAGRIVGWMVRCAFALAAWHVVAVVAFPAQRFNDYAASALEPKAWESGGFWLFAGYWLVVAAVYVVGYAALATQDIDHAEADRAVASAVASGFVVAATAMPPAVSLGCVLLAMILVLWGQFRYTVAGGRRAVFLSRFLSPQVDQLVRSEGLASIAHPRHEELSVVACDLRDFTPYAEGVPSQAVVDLLTDYYDAVGEAVSMHGGTIINYAGDGVLILVGAPIHRPDHAEVALSLAQRLLASVEPVLTRWSTRPHPLGLGAGVASGLVTVGTIGSSMRMEYTAVGTTVNLAARLCSAARAGEVLVAGRTAELADGADMVRRDPMPIKGLSGLQPVFALEGGVRSPGIPSR